MLKRLFVIGIILLFAGSAYAATAGNTSDTRVPYGPGIANMEASGLGPFKLAFDGDWILNKDLSGESGVSSAEIEGQKYIFRLGYDFADRIEPYMQLGFCRLKASWRQNGTDIKAKSEHGLVLGLGGKVLVFEVPEHRFRFSVDGKWQYMDPDIKQGDVNMPNRSISATEFTVNEWQVVGIVSMEFVFNYDKDNPAAIYSLIPYAGVGYCDSQTDVNFKCGGQDYDIGGASNEDLLLLVTGCDVTSPENLSLNVEGRWIGETAVSGGFTAKF
jgi:hypothetical protein